MFETKREVPCCVCNKPIEVVSKTMENPEVPELLRAVSPDAWIGLLCTENGHEVAVTCDDDCTVSFFAQMIERLDTSANEVDATKIDTQPAPPGE